MKSNEDHGGATSSGKGLKVLVMGCYNLGLLGGSEVMVLIWVWLALFCWVVYRRRKRWRWRWHSFGLGKGTRITGNVRVIFKESETIITKWIKSVFK